MNKKTLLALSVTAAVFSQTSVLQAQTIHTEFDGLFTMLDQGTPIQNASSSLIYYNDPTWGYGLRSQISGTMSFDTQTGAGSVSINPFEFFNAPNDDHVYMSDFNIQGIGDGNGNAGSLILGNATFNWNGVDSPFSIVWDAIGFLSQNSYYTGQVISNVGATPATDNMSTSFSPAGSVAIGASPFATTSYDTSATCNPIITGDCADVNPIGELPLTDDGIGGSYFVDGPFTGFSASFDITSVTVVSAVPVPAAIWLFASGLLGLAGLSRKKSIK